jgi:hypothetical protein
MVGLTAEEWVQRCTEVAETNPCPRAHDMTDPKARYLETKAELDRADEGMTEHYIPMVRGLIQEGRCDEAYLLLAEIPRRSVTRHRALAMIIEAGFDVEASEKALVWKTSVESLIAAGLTDQALDLLFKHTDGLARVGQFEACGAALLSLDLSKADTYILVGVLACVKRFAEKVPAYSTLFQVVATRVQAIAPDRAESLLKRLHP